MRMQIIAATKAHGEIPMMQIQNVDDGGSLRFDAMEEHQIAKVVRHLERPHSV